MSNKNILIQNINRIHSTDLGIERIEKNLKLEKNAVDFCKEKIKNEKSVVMKKGKNYYVTIDNYEITVNASSFTIITAHFKKKR